MSTLLFSMGDLYAMTLLCRILIKRSFICNDITDFSGLYAMTIDR